jgi:transcriptional regulator with XRE-family HTH domain
MKLSEYLKAKNINAAQFAARVGMDKSAITRILKGERTPRRSTINTIIQATSGEVTAADIFAEAA